MKTIGIYNGRFQPPHKGHLSIYNKLKSVVGPDTFIVSSDKVEPTHFPLSFAEKEAIWVKHGIPSSHVIKVKNGYSPVEVVQKYPDAAIVFAVSNKDKPRFIISVGQKNGKEVWLTGKGTESYFQPYESNKNNMEVGRKHGYVIFVEDAKVDGKEVNSTDIRNALGAKTQSEDNKRKFFQWVFGWFDPSLFRLLVDKFSSQDVNFKPSKPDMKEYITNLVRECILELMGDPPLSATPSGIEIGLDEPDYSSEQRAKDTAQAKINAQKEKQATERDLATKKKELDYKKRDVERMRRDVIPDLEKQRQELNKRISGQI